MKEKKNQRLATNVGIVPEDDLDGTLGSHDGNLGRGPGVVDITAEVLGAHDIVGTTIGLPGNDGDLGHGGLSVGVEQLGTMADDL